MAISKEITLACDLCGAEFATDWYIMRLREDAKEAGWAFSRGKDICPNCRQRKPKGWTDEQWEQIRPDTTEGDKQ
jgi:hypothetical protein